MFSFKSYVVLGIGLLLAQVTHAQNKVVVIPMAGDDVAMAQQHFRYHNSTSANGDVVFSCTSDVFNTPNQETQVLLIANASARFTADSSYWWIQIEVSKDLGPFSDVSASTAFTEASNSGWTHMSTTDILDLEPNSSYQFRVQLDGSQSTGSFTATQYCELVVSASYKLPAGKSILEVSP